MSNIQSNVEAIRQEVEQAARRSGRNPDEVTIIAVSKTRTVEEIREVVACGLTHLGENRVQELSQKYPLIADQVTWHLIGTLQTNKAGPAAEMAHMIHSLDRESLIEALARQSEQRGTPCSVLVQVNVSGEDTKHGVAPPGLLPLLRRISERGHLRVCGLMTMAPLDPDPERSRPHFRRLRELLHEARQIALPNVDLQHLSMGMSGDYVVAVEEGATLVRIGTAIFGTREYPARN